MGVGADMLDDYLDNLIGNEAEYAINKTVINKVKKQLMSNLTVEGNIKLIGEIVTFDSGFTKRQIVVTTNDQYPQEIAVDFVKDGTGQLDNFAVGQDVTISVNLRGNEYNGKYYVSLNGWKIELDNGTDLPG